MENKKAETMIKVKLLTCLLYARYHAIFIKSLFNKVWALKKTTLYFHENAHALTSDNVSYVRLLASTEIIVMSDLVIVST